MKLFIILLSVLAFVISQDLDPFLDDNLGCVIEENEEQCCWMNNNGCCEPPSSPDQMCTQALTLCCKTRVFDEKTQTFRYKYK